LMSAVLLALPLLVATWVDRIATRFLEERHSVPAQSGSTSAMSWSPQSWESFHSMLIGIHAMRWCSHGVVDASSVSPPNACPIWIGLPVY
jgi:hypothetical protein